MFPCNRLCRRKEDSPRRNKDLHRHLHRWCGYTLYDGSPHPSQTHIGNDVSVGHNATIHGAIIEDNCLIGMGATILDNAVVASGCIIAANALVLSNSKLEPNSVYAGVPAKKVKEVTPEQREQIIQRIANDYRMYASWYDEE